jgi:hypothetical protein
MTWLDTIAIVGLMLLDPGVQVAGGPAFTEKSFRLRQTSSDIGKFSHTKSMVYQVT